MIKNKKKPNIIYILADDMGYGDISCLNENSRLKTINIDALAKRGIRFTDAHSTSAVCTPSRYSILTGRYNWRSSLEEGVLFGYDNHLIENETLTVAKMLQQNRYKTACVGKWHLGMDWEKDEAGNIDFLIPIKNSPIDAGFDYFYGISASLDMPPYVYIENNKATEIPNHITKNDDPYSYWREGLTAPDFKHSEVLPQLTKKATELIEEYQNEQFFIYFPLPAPHTPILPSEEYIGKSGTNVYGDFVLMCDDVVGKIMYKLKELNLDENTIIVYTSDNGCSPRANYPELKKYGHNPSYVFRGYKADIYEGGHRIPLIVSWPDVIEPGSVIGETVCLVDFMATIAEAIDVDLPYNSAEDSISNYGLWQGKKYFDGLREATVHHSINGSFSIRKGKWKLELCPDSGGWSYPRPGDKVEGLAPVQLYNLDDDIKEENNIYDKFPEVVNELKIILERYIERGRSR